MGRKDSDYFLNLQEEIEKGDYFRANIWQYWEIWVSLQTKHI